jgi:hypothetical protein
MSENRIVTELLLEKSYLKAVSDAAGMLEKNGISAMVASSDDPRSNSHLVVENKDLPKAREALRNAGLTADEKEVVLARVENRPGTLAEAMRKVAAAGINLTYAFSLYIREQPYVLFCSSDNKKALDALS